MGSVLAVMQHLGEFPSFDSAGISTGGPNHASDGNESPEKIERAAVASPTIRSSKLQNEAIVDALRFLERGTLVEVQLTCRRFRQLVDEHMSAVCLRPLMVAELTGKVGANWRYKVLITPTWKSVWVEEKSMDLIDWLMRRVRCSAVLEELKLHNVCVTSDFLRRIQPLGPSVFITGQLTVYSVSASPETLRELLTETFGEVHTIRLDSRLDYKSYFAAHISDDLLRAAAKKSIKCIHLPTHKPCSPSTSRLPRTPFSTTAWAVLRPTNLKSKVTSRVLLAIGKLRPHNQDTSGYDDIRQQLRQCEMWDFKRGDLRFQIFIHQSDDADPLASTIELRRWKGPTDGSNFFC